MSLIMMLSRARFIFAELFKIQGGGVFWDTVCQRL